MKAGYACYRRPQSLRLNVFRFVGALQGFRQFECRCGRPLIGNSSNLWLPRSPTTLGQVFLNITNWETPYSVSLIAANWRLNYQIIKGSSRAVMGWKEKSQSMRLHPKYLLAHLIAGVRHPTHQLGRLVRFHFCELVMRIAR